MSEPFGYRFDAESISADLRGITLVVVEFLEKSPVLEDYDFKPWSAELTEQVNERLATYRHDGKSTGAKKPVIEAAISQEDVDVDTDEYEEKVDTKSEDDDFLEGIDL